MAPAAAVSAAANMSTTAADMARTRGNRGASSTAGMERGTVAYVAAGEVVASMEVRGHGPVTVAAAVVVMIAVVIVAAIVSVNSDIDHTRAVVTTIGIIAGTVAIPIIRHITGASR